MGAVRPRYSQEGIGEGDRIKDRRNKMPSDDTLMVMATIEAGKVIAGVTQLRKVSSAA